MLENSLYRKFERDLDQIGLPEPELWFPAEGKRAGGAPRIVLAAIVSAALVAGLVVASQRFTAQPKSEIATESESQILSPSANHPIRIPGSISAAGPAALDTCQLIARAAFDLGFSSVTPLYASFRTLPEGLVFEHADGPWGSHPCAFGRDGGWADPHLIVRPAATSAAEAERLLGGSTEPTGTAVWVTDGDGVWIARCPATPASAAYVVIAVSADPYFLLVTGPNEEMARKLMQGVLDQIETR